MGETANGEILPYTHLDSNRFYTGDNLLPMFEAYIERRDVILEEAQRTINQSDSLLQELRKHLED